MQPVGVSDWLPGVIAGVVSGVGSGLGAAVLGPGAAARAEATRQRFEERRAVVAGARQLVREVGNQAMRGGEFASDMRYMAIRRHLSQAVRNRYEGQHTNALRISTGNPHREFMQEVDRLEKQWKLS
jgi:hypothetical protein